MNLGLIMKFRSIKRSGVPPPPSPKPPNHLRGLLIGIGLLVIAIALFFQVKDTAEGNGPERAAALAIASAREKALGEFFDKEAKPLLDEAKKKNIESVDRALAGVDAAFARYQEGIPAFASDMTGWGTRFRIIWRSSVETVEGKDDHSWTQSIVTEKFAEHIMSEARLETDLTEVFKQFSYDLLAGRNEMLTKMQARVEASGLVMHEKQLAGDGFSVLFEERLQGLLAKMPGQTVFIGVGSLAAGIIAEEAVRQMVRVIVAQVAARLAATALASGGATAGAAAAGAGGGTAVAPGVGTVIGLAGGFIVGAVVDWWMTDKFEEEISAQCSEFLNVTKGQLVEGKEGLRFMMLAQIESASEAYEKAVHESLSAPIN
jgi:hypothetical protein